jgi:hypothetical protein
MRILSVTKRPGVELHAVLPHILYTRIVSFLMRSVTNSPKRQISKLNVKIDFCCSYCCSETMSMHYDHKRAYFNPPDDILVWAWRPGGMILTGVTEEVGEKPVPVPLCSPQIPHGTFRAQTRGTAARSRRLIAWATARLVRPIKCKLVTRTSIVKWMSFLWRKRREKLLQHYNQIVKCKSRSDMAFIRLYEPWKFRTYMREKFVLYVISITKASQA